MGFLDNPLGNVKDAVEDATDVVDEVKEGDLGGAVDEITNGGNQDTETSTPTPDPSPSPDPSDGQNEDSGGGGNTVVREQEPAPEPDFSSGGGNDDSTENAGGNNIPDEFSGDVEQPTRTPVDEQGKPTGPTETITRDELPDRENSEKLPMIDADAPKGIQNLQETKQKIVNEQNNLRDRVAQRKFTEPSRKKALNQLQGQRRQVTQALGKVQEKVQEAQSAIPGNDSKLPGDTINPFSGATEALLDPTRGNPDTNKFNEELLFAGADIIQESSEFGRDAARKTGGDLFEFSASPVAGGPEIALSDALAAGQQVTSGNLRESGVSLATGNTELARRRTEDINQGVFAGPGNLAGFAVGGTGAFGRTFEEIGIETARTGSAVEGVEAAGDVFSQGAANVGGEIAENPGEFAAQEIGEEIGEGVFTFGVGTALPTVTTEITPDVNLKASAGKTARNIGEEITGRVESFPQKRKGTLSTPSDNGATPDFVTDFNPEIIEPEPETTVSTESTTTETTGNTIKTNTSTIGTITSIPDVAAETAPVTNPITGAKPDAKPENVADTRPETTPRVDPFSLSLTKPEVRTEPGRTLDRTLSPTKTPSFDLGNQEQDSIFNLEPAKKTEVERDPKAAPSLDALFSQSGEQNVNDETVFSGFEKREVTENTDDIFKGLY